jgi:type IV secretory pathway VirB10-like protein
MNKWNAGLAVIVAATLAACQNTPQKSELEAKNEALEKRIAALESQPPASVPQTAPASSFVEPAPHQAPTDRVADARPVQAAPARRTVKAAPAPARTNTRVSRATRPASTSRREVIHEPADLPARNDDEVFGAEPVASMGDPAPRRERLSLAEGSELQLVLETGVSSETSNEGDRVVARVERATGPDGRILLPGGTVLQGRVTSADSAGRVRGRSRVAVDFDKIVVRGRTYDLATTSIEALGDASHKRDAAIIGGSTAAGAIIGGITKRGVKKGAVIGAVGGTGVVLATRGEQIELPSGSRWTVKVTQAARLE